MKYLQIYYHFNYPDSNGSDTIGIAYNTEYPQAQFMRDTIASYLTRYNNKDVSIAILHCLDIAEERYNDLDDKINISETLVSTNIQVLIDDALDRKDFALLDKLLL